MLIWPTLSQKSRKQGGRRKSSDYRQSGRIGNGTIDTNVGRFRAYMTLYLKRHPFISGVFAADGAHIGSTE